jgi:hypothetical protein
MLHVKRITSAFYAVQPAPAHYPTALPLPTAVPSNMQHGQTLDAAQQSSAGACTTFSDLPLHLQSHILAISSAPLNTCKSAAGPAKNQQLMLVWYKARHADPLRAATICGAWHIWCALVESGHYASWADGEAALYYAALSGSLSGVQRMLAMPVCTARQSAISMAVAAAARSGNLEVLQLLVEHCSVRGVCIDASCLSRGAADGFFDRTTSRR